MNPLHKFKCAILGKGRGNLSTDRLSLPRVLSLCEASERSFVF